MVFGFAVLAGLHDSFHLMQHLYNLNLDEGFNLPEFLTRAIPTVGLVFNWFAVREFSKLVGD